MIAPIVAAQASSPMASIQQNTEGQAVLNSNNAATKVKEEERQIKETVIKKEEAVFYEQRHDAKEEGRNKYSNLYSNKKNNKKENKTNTDKSQNRINFDLKI